jgi:hypothetical protein
MGIKTFAVFYSTADAEAFTLSLQMKQFAWDHRLVTYRI